ncbi:AlpA family phage regulatory protein [Tabrizicola sp. WMC-M-20]|nr:AlpA family phage regulatory protein [Tabrizicola sp. WMC-M-20]
MSDSKNEQYSLFFELPLEAKSNPAPPTDAGAQSVPASPDEPKKPAPKRAPRVVPGPESPPATEAESPLISDQAVAKRYGVSRPTIWRWTNTLSGFPQPIKLSGGTTRWKLADLQTFDRSRSESPAHPRRKVSKARAK